MKPEKGKLATVDAKCPYCLHIGSSNKFILLLCQAYSTFSVAISNKDSAFLFVYFMVPKMLTKNFRNMKANGASRCFMDI